MAKNSIRDFDATSGNNTDIQSVDISEGCAASGINNAIRELMVDLKNVSTGAVNLETPAADSLTVAGDLTVDTNTLKVDSSNNRVGISENSPDTKLHLTDHTANAGPVIRLEGNSQNTAGNLLGGIECFNADASGDGPNVVSAIKFLAHSAIDHGGQITFSTHDGTEGGEGSAPVERVRIDQDGKLLINAASSDTDDLLQIESPASGGGHGIQIRRNDSNTDQQVGSIRFGNTSDSDLGQIAVKTDGAVNSGAILFSTASAGTTAERMRLVNQNGGDLNFGGMSTFSFGNTETQINKFQINSGRNTTSARTHMAFGNPNGQVGSITTNGSSTAFETSSDHRLKQGVEDMTGAIDRVKALAPKRFQFVADADTTVDGFLAHEAQAVVPEAVSGTKDEVDDDGNPVMQGIDQSKLVPLLTAALKESIAKIETLETEMTALKARVTALEA